MKSKFAPLLLAATAALLAACSASTTIKSAQPETLISIKDAPPVKAPLQRTFSTTTFGNYEFRAIQGDNEPFYGILPLKFNGGYLALDILFFAPLAFHNLREVYAEYVIDAEKGQIRFRQDSSDSWRAYEPTPAESQRAREYYSK